jgi:hypothetical protein
VGGHKIRVLVAKPGLGRLLPMIAPFLAKRACAPAAEPLSDWSRWACVPFPFFTLRLQTQAFLWPRHLFP